METKQVLVAFHFFNTKSRYEHKKIREVVVSVPNHLQEKWEIAEWFAFEVNGNLHSCGDDKMIIVDYIEEIILTQSN
jgi:hypothetical protein